MFFRTFPPCFLHHPSVNFSSKNKPKKYFVIEFFDEITHAENLDIAVDIRDGLGETIVVNTTDKVCNETSPNVQINAGEDELV